MSVNMNFNSVSIKNNEGWQLASKEVDGELSFQLQDRWGLSPHETIEVILHPKTPCTSSSIPQWVNKEICQIHSQNNRFGFQVYKQEGRYLVVFGNYGLSGGGKNEKILGFCASLGGCIASALLYVNGKKTEAKLVLGYSLPALVYVASSDKDDFEAETFNRIGLIGLGTAISADLTSRLIEKGINTLVATCSCKPKDLTPTLALRSVKWASASLMGYLTQNLLQNSAPSESGAWHSATFGGSISLLGAIGAEMGGVWMGPLIEELTFTVIHPMLVSLKLPPLENLDKKNDMNLDRGVSLLLICFGLTDLNRGNVIQASLLLGGAIPSYEYTSHCDPSIYNTEDTHKLFFKGTCVTLLGEAVRVFAPLPKTAAQKMGIQCIHTILSRNIEDLFMQNPLSLKRTVISGFSSSVGAFVEYLLPTSKTFSVIESKYCDSISEGDRVFIYPTHPQLNIMMLNLFKSLLNKSTSLIIENKFSGNAWSKYLGSTLFYRMLIAAADNKNPKNEFEQKQGPLVAEALRAHEEKQALWQSWEEWSKTPVYTANDKKIGLLSNTVKRIENTKVEISLTQQSELIAPGTNLLKKLEK